MPRSIFRISAAALSVSMKPVSEAAADGAAVRAPIDQYIEALLTIADRKSVV